MTTTLTRSPSTASTALPPLSAERAAAREQVLLRLDFVAKVRARGHLRPELILGTRSRARPRGLA